MLCPNNRPNSFNIGVGQLNINRDRQTEGEIETHRERERQRKRNREEGTDPTKKMESERQRNRQTDRHRNRNRSRHREDTEKLTETVLEILILFFYEMSSEKITVFRDKFTYRDLDIYIFYAFGKKCHFLIPLYRYIDKVNIHGS